MGSLFSWLRSSRTAAIGPGSARERQERLLADRVVTLFTAIDEAAANVAIAQLLYLQHADPHAGITLQVNSPGGAILPALAIADTILELSPEVSTVCLGRADGAAALVVAAGKLGARFALPGATFAMTPIELADRSPEALATLDRILDRFAALTARPRPALERLMREERRLDPEEAKVHGFIDAVLEGPRR
jgi:ATP-dependent Clp protease protease subunit